MWPFHCSRCDALEAKLERELERHTRREDALLNRVLSKAGAYPILEDELIETPESLPPAPPPGLDDVKETFWQWGRDAGKSDYQITQEWEANKDVYLNDLG